MRAIYLHSRAIYLSSYRATHVQVFYYPQGTHARLLDDLRVLFQTWLRMLTIIDHHNVLRLVLGLVSRSQYLCHRALIH